MLDESEFSLHARSESNCSLGGDDLTECDLDGSSQHSQFPAVGSTPSSSNRKEKKGDIESAIHQGSNSLLRWRSCILLVWILSSIAISVAAFFYLTRLEEQEFEQSVS
jgi:hypothetical protein